MEERRRSAPVHSTVHLLCGLPGAGKTTLARQLEAGLPAVRFSLDEWMLRLYPDLHFADGDYAALAETCKLLIWDIARQVLNGGTDVVLDWNQWNRQRRAAWAGKAEAAGAASSFTTSGHRCRPPSSGRPSAPGSARLAHTGSGKRTSGTWPGSSRSRNRRKACGSCPDTGRRIP